MEDWASFAQRTETFSGCGSHVHGPYRIVIHSTEGDTIAGALATYRATGNYPHFTVDDSTIEQHCGLSVGSTALRHPAGTPETNRASAIQIEVVGHAVDAPNWSEAKLANLRQVCEWVASEAQVDLKKVAPFKAYPASAGSGNGLRFSAGEWLNFNGACAHMNVPNNDHGDAGLFNVAAVFPQIQSTSTTTDVGDVTLKRIDYYNVTLGSDGNGWVWCDAPDSSIVNIQQQGSYPPTDGYWPIATYGHQSRVQDGHQSVIEIQGGRPNQLVSFHVWTI